MLVDFIKLLMFWICRAFFCIFYIFPIKNNRIAFISYKGSQYSCNPKAVSEYILSNYPDKFDIIWGIDNPETYDGIINKNVHVIKHGTMKFYKYLLTSKTVVTNVDYLSYVRFRKGQYIVQTWHGGGSYKKVGNCTKNVSKLVLKRRSYFNLRTDAFISSSATFTNDTILGSFSYKGRIVNSGMPRNDILFTENNEKAKQIKQKIGVPEDAKILIYAPTYRQIIKYTDYLLDEKRLKHSLEERFGGNWVILYRLHPMLKCSFDSESHDVINVSDYNDMQELLWVSDILMTDYSSSMWDFSLTHKPCFLFATDLNEYQNERDFYSDIHTWPFILAENNDELNEKILSYNDEEYRQAVKKYHEDMGSYEKGSACKQITDIIMSECGK